MQKRRWRRALADLTFLKSCLDTGHQEAASDGGSGGTNHTVVPQHDHAASHRTKERKARTRGHRQQESKQQIGVIAPRVPENISLLHTLKVRTKTFFFALPSDKEVWSVNPCTNMPRIQLRCRGSPIFYTDGEFGWDNAGLCDFQSWFGRLQLMGCQIRPSPTCSV